MTISADYQMEFGGLLIGAETDYSISYIDGLASYPDVQTSDQSRLRRHGLLPGDDFAGGRAVTVTLTVKGEYSQTDMSTLMQALKAALPIGSPESELSFQIPGVADGTLALINARPRRVASAISNDGRWRVASSPEVMVEFFATDPRIYAPYQTGLVDLPTASGGITFSLTFDFTFGAVGDGGSMTATNDGTAPTPAIITIYGPCTTPAVRHVEQDKTLSVDITLGTGDYLTINTDRRTVLLNGDGSSGNPGANRYNYLTSPVQWFDLDPGDNTLSFTASVNTSGTASVQWRSAWF